MLLNQEVFHEPYVVAGALVSVKGLLNTVIAPYVGAAWQRSAYKAQLA